MCNTPSNEKHFHSYHSPPYQYHTPKHHYSPYQLQYQGQFATENKQHEGKENKNHQPYQNKQNQNKQLKHHNRQFPLSHQNKRTLHITNIDKSVTEQDLYQFFGLNTTEYLKQNCEVELPSAASLHGDILYGYITAPSEVCNQLKQLNGVLVHGREIIIEESQTKLKNKVDSESI